MSKLWRSIVCRWRGHDYTCAAAEGEGPTEAQVKAGISGFYDYARMYCKRCGHVYSPTQEKRK